MRPLRPKRSALPSCATSRYTFFKHLYTSRAHGNDILNKVKNQAINLYIFLTLRYNDFTMKYPVQNLIHTNTVASAIVQTLIKVGVDSIFGYPGASVLSIYNELSYTTKINHYLVRHEQAAVHAAEGYARSSGKAGVVLVTSGPGFTNTITGITNAFTDSTPLVVLVGDISSNNRQGKLFQNVDILSMTQSCSKMSYMLKENDDAEQVIKNAFKVANSGVKGPVVIALPRNILEQKYSKKTLFEIDDKVITNNYSDIFKKLTTLICNSKKPLILVGGGAVSASREITDFSIKYKIPVVSTLMGIGVYPSTNELYMGMIGINGSYVANSAIDNCDLIIALGAAFSDRSTCKKHNFMNGKKIVSINLNTISKDFELEIIADVKNFLSKYIRSEVLILDNNEWLTQINAIKNEFIFSENSNECLHSSYVLATLSEYTREYSPIVVTDVGQHQMLTAQFYHFNEPGKFITSGGLGTMGFGLPASIGAYIANRNSLVLNITGDGSFQMNLQELATCREHNIPVKIIIMNNGYLGMVRQIQDRLYGNRYQVKMTNPDFVKIAEAYDLFAVRVTNKNELIPAIKLAIDHNGTAIVDIMIDSFEEI